MALAETASGEHRTDMGRKTARNATSVIGQQSALLVSSFHYYSIHASLGVFQLTF
jgi:hypothetical protein